MPISENVLRLWQTPIFVYVNITLPIKYALTRCTETSKIAAHLKQTNSSLT